MVKEGIFSEEELEILRKADERIAKYGKKNSKSTKYAKFLEKNPEVYGQVKENLYYSSRLNKQSKELRRFVTSSQGDISTLLDED